MKNDKKIIEEVNKCSRCTLCLSVCPLYHAAKDELKSAKGFLNIIYGLLTNQIKLKKNIDLNCTNCNKCQSFCPSDINFIELLAEFKSNFKIFALKKFLFKIKMTFLMIFLKFYRIFNLQYFFKNNFLNKLCSSSVKIDKKLNKITKKKKVIFFEGCFNHYINSNSKNSIINLLSRNGYYVIVPNFGCCNINSYFEGDFDYYKKSWQKKIKKISQGVDFIIFDCDTCLKSFKIYVDKFDKNVNLKCLSFTEFLEQSDIKLIQNDDYSNLIYHKPCHTPESNMDILNTKIKNLKNIENFNKCCGFGSLFGLKNFKLSKKIAKSKFNDVKINPDNTIITSCNLCRIGLILGLLENNIDNGAKVINISELFL